MLPTTDKPSNKLSNTLFHKENRTIWIIVAVVLLVALLLIACIATGGDRAASRITLPTGTPALSPAPSISPTPEATALPEGYRLPLVPIFDTPEQTMPPTPYASFSAPFSTFSASSPPEEVEGEADPITGVYTEEERTFLAAGFLEGEPVALFVIRQQGDKLTALSLCPKTEEGLSLGEAIAALKKQVEEEAGISLTEYVYMDFAALPTLSKAAGAEEAYVAMGQEALSLAGEEQARAMLLLGAKLFDALKDISPLNALLLQSSISGQWGSSLKLSRLWGLGSAMKKCSERVLVLVPEGGSAEQKKILKNFFVTR